ncbi:MAG: DUF975 family protein [Clostridia bacterium]
MTRTQIKDKAKEDIRDIVFLCFIPILIVELVQYAINAILGYYTKGVLSLFITLLLIPINLGVCKIFLQLIRNGNKKIDLTDLFFYYKDINKTVQFVIAWILRMLYIFLGICCLIIPGIIMSLRYSLLEYVHIDDPTLSYKELMNKTKAMMIGHSGELFAFYLSFLGWVLLSVLTCGILFVYVLPYMKAAEANFYENIRFAVPNINNNMNNGSNNNMNNGSF